MALLWNGDWETGDRSQYGDWEYVGSQGGGVPISARVTVASSIDGITPLQGTKLAKIVTQPLDRYGGSSGARTIARQYDPIRLRPIGSDSWYVFAILVRSGYPGGAAVWQTGLEFHQSKAPYVSVTGVAPFHTFIYANNFRVDCAGHQDNNGGTRIVNFDVNFMSGYTKGAWYVWVVRYHDHVTNGDCEVYCAKVGTPLALIAEAHGVSTVYEQTQNHMLYGQYRRYNVGTGDMISYHDGVREFSTRSEAMDYANALLSGSSPPPPTPLPPANTTLPSIAGVAAVGATLAASPGIWTGTPTFAYQWQSSSDGSAWVDIAGASGSSYLIDGLVGRLLRVRVIGTNPNGSTTAHSASVGPVDASIRDEFEGPPSDIADFVLAAGDGGFPAGDILDFTVGAAPDATPVNTVAPTVTGTPTEGELLTADDGTWTDAVTFTRWWQTSSDSGTTWLDVWGETDSTWLIGIPSYRVGDLARVGVTAVNGTESATAYSAAVGPIAAAAPAATPTSIRLVVEAAFGSEPDAETPVWTTIKDTSAEALADYPTTVLADSPVGYWRFNETTGTLADSSGNGHDGIATGGVTYAQAGAVDTSLALDGASGVITVADHADFDTGDTFTLEAWINPADLSHQPQAIFDKGTDSYRLEIDTLPRVRVSLYKAGTGLIAATTPSAEITASGEWRHVVATKDGADVHLYVDAIDVTGTITDQTVEDNSHTVSIGGPTALYYEGGIDEVAIYDTALTPERVLAHFQAQVSEIAKYVRMMSWQRGRNTPLERIETGTGSLVLRNADRRWDPTIHPDVRPMLPIRAYAVTEALRQLPIFNHNADGFPRRHLAPSYAEVTLTTVDAMEGLAGSRVPPNRATLTTAFSGPNNDLTFTARQPGPDGNDITITITETKFHPLRQQRVVVSVQGKKILVDYIDHTQGTPNPPGVEAGEIKAAIELLPAAHALVEVAYPAGNDGTGEVLANLPETHLAGGDVAAFPEELGGARINRILTLAGWPADKRKTSAGRDLHGAIDFPTDQPAMLSHIQDIVGPASENGLLYVDGARNFVFIDRLDKLRAPRNIPQLVFSDLPVGSECKYVNVTPHHGKDFVINDVTGSRPDGDEQAAYNADSVRLYRRRSQSFSSTLATDTQVKSALEMIVAEYGEPQERLREMQVMPGRDWAYWEKLLLLDVGSLVTVKEHAVGGNVVVAADDFNRPNETPLGSTTGYGSGLYGGDDYGE